LSRVANVALMTPSFTTVGLVVADLTESMAFYRQLGLVINEIADEHVECELPGGLRLTIDTERAIALSTPEWVRPSGSPRVSLTFQLAKPSEVDRLFTQLVHHGGKPAREPWNALWRRRRASVLDPDGNQVDLFADLPE
jgi:predicted lactoylglutathione lyase